uniref:F-box/LRR-repeat protein 15/At3g58940/PEG3-like LRR domain-containing protein n=1 Tax=Kalanchoe fedtschenkoi TaxID=63787 RepID=A0A7N0RAJ6_KALFE
MEGAGRRIPRDAELGDLPSSVVETIVSFMSISDAVRAALVGNDWREGWKFTKDLDFDKPFFDDFIAGTTYQLDAVVNSIMSRHAGQVTSFNICIPEDIPDDLPVDISEGISILSQKEVEYLTVNVFRNVYLELPSAVYSCSRLVKLELEGCQLCSAPNFNGFPVLTCLRLADVVVDDDVLNSMICHSPQLQQLDLEFWMDGNPVEFHHAAPENLESVYYQCKEGCRRPLRLSGFPNLTHAAFETELQFPFLLELQFTVVQWRSCRLEHLANLIPQVQELSLNDLAITHRLIRMT